MNKEEIIKWLLEGDVSIQYQVYRDLLQNDRSDLRNRISKEGWGAALLSKRNRNGHWGKSFYQPKWTSSHYTLLDLRNLNIAPDIPQIKETIDLIINNEKANDGGVNPGVTVQVSDVCLNGMFLNFASYFETDEEKLKSIVDFILSQHMADGGFNCRSNRSGAIHSSLHTTISALEGISEFEYNGYTYRLDDLKNAAESGKEFILQHQLYKSDKTGKVIHNDFLKLSYPHRWRYNILRAMDYFRYSHTKWDNRMQDSIDVILYKRNKDFTWPLQAKHPGQTHIEMEKAGKPSRWNTLIALRVLEFYGIANN
jgi:hypothetical protein